jgi:hypothetical protein
VKRVCTESQSQEVADYPVEFDIERVFALQNVSGDEIAVVTPA